MKRLTPQEFLLSKIRPDCIWEEIGNLTNCPIETVAEIMQQYAEHLEETAWVTDGSLPPKCSDDCYISQNVVIFEETGRKYIGDYNHKDGLWREYNSDEVIFHRVKMWRPLPTPPKNS